MLKWMKPLPKQEWKRLYILDSSFNPPHYAHLQILGKCPKEEGFAHMVLFATTNMDKKTDDVQSRLEMIGLLDEAFAVTDCGRFCDKALLFSCPTTFLMGYDTIVRFFDPKYYNSFEETMNQFFQTSRIRVIDRGDHRCSMWDRDELKHAIQWKNGVEVEGPIAPISSTDCRKIVRNFYKGKATRSDLEQLMPKVIVDYILEHNLYSEAT
jgi:nicotinamide-nucleotide adenylyltransferase